MKLVTMYVFTVMVILPMLFLSDVHGNLNDICNKFDFNNVIDCTCTDEMFACEDDDDMFCEKLECDVSRHLNKTGWDWISNSKTDFKVFELTYSYDQYDQDSFPQHVFQRFTELKWIILDRGNMPTLKKNSFQRLSKLELIQMTNNNMKSIEIGAIADLPKLKNLTINGDKFQRIVKNMFQNLPNIQGIDLNRNEINDIEDGAFEDISSLTSLSLSLNKIKTLNSRSLAGMKNLIHLELNSNQVAVIEEHFFDGLESLMTLELGKNKITRISSGAFKDLKSLRYLNLGDNKLYKLPANLFANIPLKSPVINLVGNKLKTLKLEWIQPLQLNDTSTELYFNDNPLACNCDLKWALSIENNYLMEMRISEVKCEVIKQYPYTGLEVGSQVRLDEFRYENIDLCSFGKDHAVILDRPTTQPSENKATSHGINSQVADSVSNPPSKDEQKENKQYVAEEKKPSSATLISSINLSIFAPILVISYRFF